ncbi:SPFH domain-containing protein [Candidatus Uabimicrobium sp. HlEnr_7]|uniref:protease modulator HflC n=1 Tax=Candidatus Uabimicrobium helgolandensis TaxID=3095367 RepID=UPI0035566D6A
MTTENKNENKTKTRPNIVTLIVAIIIAATVLFYYFTFQVRITEKAVITTFGKPTTMIDPSNGSQPGLYWKWPYPFQNVDIFDARTRIFTGTLEQIFTSDGKSIILQTYTGWQVDDPAVFLTSTGNEWDAKIHLESSIRGHTYNIVAKYTFNQVLSFQKGKSFLEKIEEAVKKETNKDAVNFGFIVTEFGFRRLVLPESTTKEVANRMKEERNRLAQRYLSEGTRDSKIERNKADAAREEKIIMAEARAKEIEGEAFAEIADEYKIFAQDKKLAIWLRKLESLRNILKANRSTLLLDPSTKPFDLLQNSNIQGVFSESDKQTKKQENSTDNKTDQATHATDNKTNQATHATDNKTDQATHATDNKTENSQENASEQKNTDENQNSVEDSNNKKTENENTDNVDDNKKNSEEVKKSEQPDNENSELKQDQAEENK